MGHIRDLGEKGLGIDFENNYAPQYEVSADKKKLVTELKKKVKKQPIWFGWLPMRTAKEKHCVAFIRRVETEKRENQTYCLSRNYKGCHTECH